LPFSNEGFAFEPGDSVTVCRVLTTEPVADPLTSAFASVLVGPLRQLYALLWRAGVVEIVTTHPTPRRTALCPTCRSYVAECVP